MKRKVTKTTDAKGVTTRTRVGAAGRTTTKTVNAKGRVTGVTKTRADGTTRTLSRTKVAARNKLKSGKAGSAVAARSKIADLKSRRKEAKKAELQE